MAVLCAYQVACQALQDREVKDLGGSSPRRVVACIFKYHVRGGELGFRSSSKVARSPLDFYSNGTFYREFAVNDFHPLASSD